MRITCFPRCGGGLTGLKTDSEAREIFDFARTRRFILREERTFLEAVER